MTYYAPWLVTLNYVRQHRRLETAETDNDALLQTMIGESSTEFMEGLHERIPMPYEDTKRFGSSYLSGLDLKLRDDLLAVSSITNGNGEAIASNLYNLRPDNRYPKNTVELVSNGGTYWNLAYREDRVVIPGTWGYVPNYATCWRNSTAVIPAGNLTDSATSVALAAGKGALFEVGQYISVVTSSVREVMQVTAISTDTLTLARGELGTTAAVHTSADVIYQYRQLADIQQAVREMVVYKYLAKDKIGGTTRVYEGGTLIVEDISPSVEATRKRHARKHMPRAV